MFRCARTTCTEPRTDIVLLQMFAQRASEVTAVSQAVCGCLSFSKSLWDFSLFPDIKRALSSDCLGNPSCCLVTAADSTSAGMWFSCKRRRREADGLIPCCVFTQVREKPDHWHRGSNVCVCVCALRLRTDRSSRSESRVRLHRLGSVRDDARHRARGQTQTAHAQ